MEQQQEQELPNIIFLDIDGVLNTTVSADFKDFHFDPTSVSFVRKLIKETNAKVVVSSTWRLTSSWLEMHQLLHVAGLGRCVYPGDDWRTKSLGGKRGDEIQEWLDRNEGKYKGYVILDDDCDMLDSQFGNFVYTDHFSGVGFREFSRAMKILDPHNPRYYNINLETVKELQLLKTDVDKILNGSKRELRTTLGAQLFDMMRKKNDSFTR